MEAKYKEFIERVPKIFRDHPSYALAELSLFQDITLDIILFHYDKYPGVKMNGFGVEALQARGKHEIVAYLQDHGLLLYTPFSNSNL